MKNPVKAVFRALNQYLMKPKTQPQHWHTKTPSETRQAIEPIVKPPRPPTPPPASGP